MQTPKIIILTEKFRGQSFFLENDFITVGRSDTKDICIKDPTLSSHHCNFIRTGEEFHLHDNDSVNGTRVNYVPVPKEGIELKNSDILQFGEIEIFYDRPVKIDDGISSTSLTTTGIFLSTVKELAPLSPFESRRPNKNKMLLPLVVCMLIAIVTLLSYTVILVFHAPPDKKLSSVQTTRNINTKVSASPLTTKQKVSTRKIQENNKESSGSANTNYYIAVLVLVFAVLTVLMKKTYIFVKKKRFAEYKEKLSSLSKSLKNNISLDNNEIRGLKDNLLNKDTLTLESIGKNFHRVIVLDCAEGIENGAFDRKIFDKYAFTVMLDTFGNKTNSKEFHPEEIAQILKDKPRSLFCLLNTELLTKANLDSLRIFTQDKHSTLIIP